MDLISDLSFFEHWNTRAPQSTILVAFSQAGMLRLGMPRTIHTINLHAGIVFIQNKKDKYQMTFYSLINFFIVILFKSQKADIVDKVPVLQYHILATCILEFCCPKSTWHCSTFFLKSWFFSTLEPLLCQKNLWQSFWCKVGGIKVLPIGLRVKCWLVVDRKKTANT